MRRVFVGCLCATASIVGEQSASAITYQDWATAEFGVENHVNSDPQRDPDGDGLSNLYEYAFILGPLVADKNPEQGGLLVHDTGQHHLFLNFPQRLDAIDLIYEVRAGARVVDLCVAEVPYWWGNGVTEQDGGLVSVDSTVNPRRVTVIDPTAPLESGASSGFLQIYVSLRKAMEPLTFVTVGDPGKGGVEEGCELGQHEITNAQFAEFLNAVAASDDEAKAYFPFMGSRPRGGIACSGTSGRYFYQARPGMADKPAAFVSFWSACRYCNWLHHGRPTNRRNLKPWTTEDGAYDLAFADTIHADQVVRKPGARYFLPSDEEWVVTQFEIRRGCC